MNQKLIITNLLSVTIAVAGTLFAIGCADDSATKPDPARSIENAPFNKVKVYVPKTEEDLQKLEQAKGNNFGSLVMLTKEQLTMEFTNFSHAYQLIENSNEELQLEEIQVSPEETLEVEHKQNLTLIEGEEGLKFESRRDGIEAHASCPLSDADATDNTLATRYLLCQGNLLVIEKEVTQDDDSETSDDETSDDETSDGDSV